MVKRYLPGANTPKGFVNFFEGAIDEPNRERVIYIKGGPGTGKSTFMKEIGSKASSLGMSVSGLPCSSDLNSIDLLIVEDIGVVLTDATSPHNSDPKFPGLTGEIINTAKYLDREKLKKSKKELFALAEEKNTAFSLLYEYLSASEKIADGIGEIAGLAVNKKQLENVANEIYNDFLLREPPLKPRKAFLDCLTAEGYTSLFEGQGADKNIGVKCDYDLGVFMFFKCLTRRFESDAAHFYMSPKKPDTLAHITAGNVNVLSNPRIICDYMYNLNGAFEEKTLKNYAEELKFLRKEHKFLLENAGRQLTSAKAAHMEMEEYFSSAMDFSALKEEIERVKKSLF